jgi:hypothetical protein
MISLMYSGLEFPVLKTTIMTHAAVHVMCCQVEHHGSPYSVLE